jgi:outer membrane immunogenic protein
MRFTGLVLLASLCAASPALATDLAPQPAEPVAPMAPPYSWTGFYIGANAGYGLGSSDDLHAREVGSECEGEGECGASSVDFDSKIGHLSPHGAFGGLQAGYNWQFGGFVLGLEGDIQGAGISDRAGGTSDPYGSEFSVFRATIHGRTKVDWFGTARPRIGYAYDNFLLYLTGGAAFGGVKDSLSYSDSVDYSADVSKSGAKMGYVLGGGVEYAITRNWTAKLEYQYIDFGDETLSRNESRFGGPASM